MIHLEWHACKDKPVDDSFKLNLTDETFAKHAGYNTTGIGIGLTNIQKSDRFFYQISNQNSAKILADGNFGRNPPKNNVKTIK